MIKQDLKECEHEIGYKTIGGFPGHEHTHPTGEQVCLKCGKTLKEILDAAYNQGLDDNNKKGESWRLGYQAGHEEGISDCVVKTRFNLLKIADQGEFEDMRREICAYFKEYEKNKTK